jgi:predicted amidohydrolase YtcJ
METRNVTDKVFAKLPGVGLLLLLVGCGQATDPVATARGADAVFLNGRIYTVDESRSWAEAVAIADGRISFVGTNEAVQDAIGANTTVVDLDGRMMLPAFQDSHIHPIMAGMEAAACNLNYLPGVPEYRTAIAEYAAANPDVPWILGGGWSMVVFGEGGRPSKSIIDELVADRPVFLTSADGHTGWANSRALEIAGIDRDTPNPPDGIIDRDPETGEAIGSLQEGAMSLVTEHIPPASLETRVAGMRYARDTLHRFGITSIQDAMVERAGLEAYRAMERAGELNLRVVASLWWDRARGVEQLPELVALREEFSDGDLLQPTTVKIMQDGVLENFTGAMLEPYLSGDGGRGIPMVETELLKRAVTELDAEGFQVHFHAIGDAAIRQSLDAIEEALYENGRLGHRHHISHLQIIHPDDVPRFAELDAIANFQPLWIGYSDYINELNRPAIGEERTSWMYPIRSVQEAGGLVAFGSDWSVSTANPLEQIEVAVTHASIDDPEAPLFLPDERIDLASAIAAFTINAAYLNKHEDRTGSIEVNKIADLIVLDKDLFAIEPDDISDVEVVLTLFGGEPVYGDPGAL